MRRILTILSAALALQASATAAETPAAADPGLRTVFAYVTRQSTRSTTRERLQQQLRNRGGLGRGGLTRPIAIDAPERLRLARYRASALSAILSAGLNGDWRVTDTEIRTALGVHNMAGPAEALVTHDADGNGALDVDEMKAAASDKAARYSNPHSNPLKLLDFNDDGILTPAEYQRGLAAVDG